MKIESTQIGRLFNSLVENDGLKIHVLPGNYEVLDLSGMGYEILSDNGKFQRLELLSRHRTEKHLVKISTEHGKSVKVTTDHVCMRYNRDHFLENVASKELTPGDLVKVLVDGSEVLDKVLGIEDLGTISEYVYDCKVENTPCFYANGILIHNSQFLNITCIVDFFSKKWNLPRNLNDWSDDWKLKLWNFMEKFVDTVLNPYVQNLTVTNCYSEHPEVLRYALEYVGDVGIYEQKKRYGVHKVISEGPELVDKIKYTGIELKRSNVPASIKKYLQDIYEGVLLHEWDETAYKKYLDEAYASFKKLGVNDIAFWKGWSSDKVESSGFLSSGKGMTIISKAAKYYNDMLEHLGIGKKYESLKIGNKIRMVYLLPDNPYGLELMGFSDGAWPTEFDEIFHVDYPKMFEKLIIEPLKSFRAAANFSDYSPSEEVLDDIFAL